ncbi:cupin domain-containing protein [Autumnicola psychrophila]|uniref:Cupin domain-containing protein n=1 Tax=Autumnicola psychrophila TaxID=3075592 RepID=A0ABU3DRX0_9FLAO|nr:cupin domain-containing protein [Zunongwangia sp. F225]MDT0686451.1 cupin domain-containing protein [Zunongwangia sp. F225]
MKPEKYFFKDDGSIPNNKLPLLLYKNAFSERGGSGAEWLEHHFLENNWRNSWRNGVFSYHHYHSNTHEVLGVYSGSALLQLGGEKGEKLEVTAGDIIVIPAGVGHKNLGGEDFHIVGAYPDGMEHDMNYGKESERPKADENIAEVPLPGTDPLLGKEGLPKIWAEVDR